MKVKQPDPKYIQDRRLIENMKNTKGYTGKPTHHPDYNIWKGMKRRCNPKTKEQSSIKYRQKGITVCEEWVNSFATFIKDMGERPGKEYSIDRIDNNAGYSPENCRWATASEQSINKDNTIHIEYKEYKGPLKVLCDKMNLPYKVIKCRIQGSKWSVEKAIETPIYCTHKKQETIYVEYKGQTKKLKEWCKELELNYYTIKGRIKDNWIIEDALTIPIGQLRKKKGACYNEKQV